MSGYLSLSFKRGARTLVVERWGLAATLLADDSLRSWYRKDALPDIKGYKVGFEESEIAGHEGLKLDGRRSGIKQFVKAAAYSLTLNPHPKFLTGFVWHCPDSNRLFSVRATHVEGDNIAEEVRGSIECHPEQSAAVGILKGYMSVFSDTIGKFVPIGRRKPKIDKRQALAIVPVRNSVVKWERRDKEILLDRPAARR